MMSKKTFSLTIFLTIFALAFVLTPAMAQTLSVEVTKQDPKSPIYTVIADGDDKGKIIVEGENNKMVITLDVEFSHSVADAIASDLLIARAYREGNLLPVGTSAGQVPTITVVDVPGYASRTSKKRQFTLTMTQVRKGTSDADAKLGLADEIRFITSANLATSDPSVVKRNPTTGVFEPAKFDPFSYSIPLGQPGSDAAKPGEGALDRPQVVSIQRLDDRNQTVVAAFQETAVTEDFYVRIVLTEEPRSLDLKTDKPGEDANAKKLVKVVTGGSVSDLVIGTSFLWFGGLDDDGVPYPANAANQSRAIKPHPMEGMYSHAGSGVLAGVPLGFDDMYVPLPSTNGTKATTDDMYWQARVKVSPHRRATKIIIKVNEFHDKEQYGDLKIYHHYHPPEDSVLKAEDVTDTRAFGRDYLSLKVDIPKFDLKDGLRVYLPHKEKAKITYANSTPGHYILTRLKTGSGINYFHHEGTAVPDRENMAKEQTPSQLLYNVRQTSAETPDAREVTADAPQENLPNLERFLHNNGTIHLVSYHKDSKAGDAYISEVMWGTDASLANPADSNWIEIRNGTSKAIAIGEQEWALWFYEAHETPPSGADPYPANSAYEGPLGQKGTLIDVISTKDSTTRLSWSITGKGQSGRSNIDKARADAQVIAGTIPLISMYRMMDATDMTKPADGTKAANWVMSEAPSVNIHEDYEHAIVATPGAAPFDTPDSLKEAKDKEEAKTKADAAKGTYPKQGQGRVYISEIMFAGGGTLPQWIEIANGDRSTEFNLSGWTITVDNAAADADVDIASATFTIPDGTTIDASAQHDTPSTILIVTEQGRNNLTGAKASGQVINLAKANEVELITAGVLKGKYTLLSDMAFQITLAPPVPKATKAPAGETAAAKATRLANEKKEAALRKAATDKVGNLVKGAAAWALPTNEEGGRSSIIREHIQVVRGPAAPEDGMMEDNWVLASKTAFADVTHIRASSYYGAANDVGTPGFRAGGALPVELSHFRPARQKDTGQVVITWATQSELNNAGFFIKRAQQRNGEFKVINATMIAGAGTTSEKQFYTYTDTTAQPNVVYYYQIEDISLDGNRQTLTRGIRLKGHIGAAGKATTLWGELKTSHE